MIPGHQVGQNLGGFHGNGHRHQYHHHWIVSKWARIVMISGEYRSEFFFIHEKVKSYQGHGVAGKYVIATKDMPEKHHDIAIFIEI